ncbi:translocation/assembly module TamB domain-containing protein [uncultured Ferrimonas sp.]|uniref:autotransporter assembly complex protein TamB n=1 Tax=uncultured Ferrimonas sp. TaxID=432640 RepID=UPI002607CE48|nr:translocation/assembly module TamB domain-containing protein [uncultured Ferrimonas sp.]
MIRAWLFRFSLIPVSLLVVLALLLGTPFGTRVLFIGLDQLPILSVSYQSGSVSRGFAVKGFELTLPSVTVRVAQAKLQWRLGCFLDRRLCAEQLQASGIEVIVPRRAATAQPKPPETDPRPPLAAGAYRGLPLPFRIEVQQAQLANIKVMVGRIEISAERLDGVVILDNTRLWLDRTQLDGLQFVLPPTEAAQPAVASNAAATPTTNRPGPLAQLPTVDLPFAIDIDDIRVNGGLIQTGRLVQHFAHLSLQGHWHHRALAIKQFELDHDWGNLVGSASLRFEQAYPIDASLSGTLGVLPWAPQLQGLAVEAQLSNSLQQLDVAISSQGGWQGLLQGNIDFSQASLPYHANLVAESVRWPLRGDAKYQGQNVVLRSHGTLTQQQLQGSGTVLLAGYPQAELLLSAEHQQGLITLKQAEISGGMGQASGRGQLDLRDGIGWDLGLFSRGIDLAKFDPKLALQLNGSVASSGHYRNNEQWQLGLQQADLSGQWQQYPLQLQGSGQLDSQWQGQAQQMQLQLNGASLTVDGGLTDQQWDLRAQLQGQQLHNWLPQLAGSVSADVTISGHHDNPQIHLNGRSPALQLADTQFRQMALTLDYQPKQQQQLQGQLQLASLTQNHTEIGAVNAHLRGDNQRQELQLEISGNSELSLGIGGNYYPDKQQWLGGIFNARGRYNDWDLQLNHLAGVRFDLARKEAIVEQHCWLTRGTEICSRGPSLIGQRGAMAWDLSADLAQLLAPLIPPRITLQSQLSGQLALNWSPTQAAVFNFNFNDDNGQLLLKRGIGVADSAIRWQRSASHLQLQANKLLIDTEFQLNDQQKMSLSADLGRQAPYPLSGNFNANNLDLAPLLAWFRELADARVLLDGDIALAGELLSPLLTGQLRLSQGQIEALSNPTELSQLNASVDFNGDHATYSGTSKVGSGDANLDGKLYWLHGFAAEAKINGQQLDLLYPPMVQVSASPQLHLIWTPMLLSLTGDIAVEHGSFKVSSLPKGAVTVSDDVIYLDNLDQQQRQQNQRTTLDLKVRIAPQLQIDALGLGGNIGGDLQVRQLPTQPVQIYGALALRNGQFEAYGQRLSINRGQVIFNGPPSLPNLDVEATRTIDSEDLTVGVRLGGVPKAPKLTLFANRAMEQQEILSYLIRGQGLSSDGNSSLWATAALSVGVGTTGGLVTAIGEELGLRDVKLDAEGSGDDTQVTVSGYIGDKLYVKYGVDVFGEGLSELTVRYYLLQRLWLEGVSAISKEEDERSLDIYYLFEID